MLQWTLRASLLAAPLGVLAMLPMGFPTALAGIFLTPCVLMFWMIYSVVGSKVDALRADMPAESVHALMVNGMIQAPGLVHIDGTQVILQPIVGKRVVIPRTSIESTTETFAFNGKAVPGKVAFWFSVPQEKRLGLAVAKRHADAFRALI